MAERTKRVERYSITESYNFPHCLIGSGFRHYGYFIMGYVKKHRRRFSSSGDLVGIYTYWLIDLHRFEFADVFFSFSLSQSKLQHLKSDPRWAVFFSIFESQHATKENPINFSQLLWKQQIRGVFVRVCVCVWMGGKWASECVKSVLTFLKLNYLTTALQANGWQMFRGRSQVSESPPHSNFPALWRSLLCWNQGSFLQFGTAINSIWEAICVREAIKCVFWVTVICGGNRWLRNVS